MATPMCVKCDSAKFEISPVTPQGSRFKLYFVHCANCGGVVGVQEWDNIGALIAAQNKALEAIAKKVGATVKP